MGIEFECGVVQNQTIRIPVAGMQEHFKKKGMRITNIVVVYKEFLHTQNPDGEWLTKHANCQRIENLTDGMSMWRDRDIIDYLDVHMESQKQYDKRMEKYRREAKLDDEEE